MPIYSEAGNITERRRRKRLSSGGFTIVETLIAILIFAITLMGSIAVYFNTSKLSAMATHKKVASEIASAKMEEIRAMDATEYATNYNLASPPGPEDFSETGPAIVGQTASNITVRVSDNGTFCPQSGYQKVKVIVSWQEAFQGFPREVQVASCIKP